jgi:hypothetical protein
MAGGSWFAPMAREPENQPLPLVRIQSRTSSNHRRPLRRTSVNGAQTGPSFLNPSVAVTATNSSRVLVPPKQANFLYSPPKQANLLYRSGKVMISKTNRLVASASLLAALSFTMAQPSFAAAPGEEPSFSVDLDAGLGCTFPLRLDSSAGKVRTITFKTENGQPGRIINVRTGVVLTYTNLDTGESVSIKTSGSVTSAVRDGVTETRTATGHNGLILFPEDVPAGPTTTQYNGRIVYTFNTETGFVEVIETSGKATDICAELS